MQQAQSRFGGVDVLVNNAGYGYRAAVEEADDADIRQLFVTNLFGAVDMIKAVLPDMRAKRAGAILNISSIGARISPPGSGDYSATKAALEGLSGSLYKELQPLGISVTAIAEPSPPCARSQPRSCRTTSRRSPAPPRICGARTGSSSSGTSR